MSLLQKLRVLLLGAAPAELDLLVVWLSSEGAQVKVSTFKQMGEAPELSPVHAIVLDTRGDEASASAFLDGLSEKANLKDVKVIGLVSSDVAKRGSFHDRIDTYLTAPVHPAVLTQSLSSISPTPKAALPTPSSEENMATLIEARARLSDLRSVVTLLNATAPFRFTSILRFEESEQLTSVWTFDRENPETNNFPEDATVGSSYCARVREHGQPFVMPDAANDPTVATHPARHSVLSYCGVPLLRGDGSFYGTLCSYDVVPRFFQQRSLQRLLDASDVLRKHWPELVGD